MLRHGDQQGDDAVTGRPEGLRRRLDFAGPDRAAGHRAGDRGLEEGERAVAGGRVGALLARLDQERDGVVMRVGETEIDVEPQPVAQAGQRIVVFAKCVARRIESFSKVSSQSAVRIDCLSGKCR